MKKPADAAREPAGVTYTTTGARESMMCWMMSRIDVSRPPGVSIVIRTSAAPLVVGPVDAAVEVFGHDRVDLAVDVQFHHARWPTG